MISIRTRMVLLIAVAVAACLFGGTRDVFAGSSRARVYLVPGAGSGEFDLVAEFAGGSPAETLDYFRATVGFPADVLQAAGTPVTVVKESKLGRQLRVDAQDAANATGTIVIELGALTPKGGPSTDRPVRVAVITMTGDLSKADQMTVHAIQIVNNESLVIPAEGRFSAQLPETADAVPASAGFLSSLLEAIKRLLGIQ